ncbi:MAG: bifunctional N(6)-L-threonylcarbamoyladenine synthase/serine/threonine protein kinase [Methanomicrobia archaeon]|nr:bifunctional N(6)-L-threonylcarbamoyladenine synthase/serine/threonine protein kinase [Methanomicrobia archaeon]
MISLGIESTAHTLGIGIVTEKEVLANESSVYTGEGIHPRKAADHHADVLKNVLDSVLKKSDILLKDVDLISFSQGPGIGPCLRIGATAARTLSLRLKIPIIGVNHCVSHIEIGKFATGAKDPVTLYVSGGNTQIIAYAAQRYRVFGETLDIGIGNMQDMFGRALGLQFPCGKEIDALVSQGKKYLHLPYTVKGMDFSFTGVLTEALKHIGKEKKEDIAFSLMETAFSTIIEASERALAHTGKKELLLTGGVAASPRLRKMCEIMCNERGNKFYVPPFDLCRDNGAMIAYHGLIEYKSGKRMNLEETVVRQKWRTNEVEVTWLS